MKLRLKCFIIFLVFLSASCSKIAVHEKLADEKIFSFAKEVRKSEGLELCMYGGELYGQINSFSIGFVSPNLVDIDRARIEYIDLSTRFLQFVNSDSRVSECSSKFPFTKDELDLVIFYTPKSNQICGPFIIAVSMGEIDGTKRESIHYHQKDPVTGESKIILVENYDKALDILKFQQCQREMDAEMQTQPSF